MTTWLLVHSPLLGPASWSAVAAQLWDVGDTVVVPDLRPALSGGGGYAERQAELAAAATPQVRCVSLAGHSGAGPLLPVVAAALADRGIAVERAVFVDAGLPQPGRSRRSTLPDELAGHLDALTADGWLPPWPRWWPPDALTELLPDPDVRETLQRDCPPLPAQLFTEPLPQGAALPAAGYLLLSAPYAEAADEAETAGWPVVRLSADHLAPLSRPGVVAAALREVATQSSAIGNAARRHVARFNQAVRDRDWTAFSAGFAPDATMAFTNVPVGPFVGRAAIERAYREQPPTDTMRVQSIDPSSDDVADVRFAWTAGGTGSMRLRWTDGLVAELAITFD